jgi:hypothetical protein
MRVKEDGDILREQNESIESTDEQPLEYKSAFLLISNRFDAPKNMVTTYMKQERIEVFFRTAKQELALEKCHSEHEAYHHAHLELLFTAETLLNIALHELNKEKTSSEGYTHGEMVRGLFNTRCPLHVKYRKGKPCISIDCDI